MRNIAKGTASLTPMLRPRKSCIYCFVCVSEMCAYLRYSAGLAGVAVDRLVETKGVSDLMGSSQADFRSDLLSSGQ